MANFIGLDDAATQLGVAKEKLNELREAGKLRAYRDGASWKFRAEEIEDLAKNGLPPMDSDIGTSFGMGLEDDSDNELELGTLSLEADDPTDAAAASDGDLSLVDEPTVAADEPAAEATPEPLAVADDDDDLVLDLEGSGDDAESILLGEDDLAATSGPSSTIIGRNDVTNDDDDLQLAPVDDASVSDVRLAEDEPAAATPSDSSPPTPPPGKFEDIEELEIDLEAESSRILEADQVAAAKEAAAKAGPDAGEGATQGDSDLALAPSDSGELSGFSSIASDEADEVEEGLTGISSLNVDEDGSGGGSSLAGFSSIELAEDEDDDFVLGDSGSDITLSGAESGINLVAPSDSGLSLDEASAILGGSAIQSGVDLSDVSAAAAPMPSGELASSEDFMLTPLGDDDEDEEDSSQIVSVEALEEDSGEEDDVVLGGALAMDDDEDALAAGAGAGAPAVVEDASFSVWNVLGLGACLTVMLVCGMMMVDLTRAIWAYDEPTNTSSALIEGLLGLFGIS
ncbi:MAG: helix-turn-helix domain-containing protein [Planctomycetota bacterium]